MMPRERAQLPQNPIPGGFPDEIGTLTAAILRLGCEHPDSPCLIFNDRTGREEILTLGSLLARARAIQAASGGIQKTTSGKLARGATRDRYAAELVAPA